MKDVSERLHQALLELEVIDKKKLEEAWQECKSTGRRLDEILMDRDLLSDENIGKLVAEMAGLTLVRLGNEKIPQEMLKIIPEVVARKQKAIVYAEDAGGLKLAISDPDNSEIKDFVEKKSGKKVKLYFATPRDMEAAMAGYKKDLQKTFDELLREKVAEASGKIREEAPIIEMVNLLIEYAYDNRVSDIHIEPEEKRSIVRFRIDGVLHDVLTLPEPIHEQVVTRVKVEAKLRTDEHSSAQDGKVQMKLPEEVLDIRVSIVPVVHGEKVVMRLLSSRSRQFGLADLGMGDKDLDKVKRGFERSYGMVLSTGPTGCGKSTTVYSILKILNVREINIATIEDPVEYDIAGINQIQVNAKTNLTFASGLRAILRQDPNVIFVGEIRDQETAGIAVNSAMTGHLVLSTLHTNDAATTIPRLLDMGVEPFLAASTVNVIIGQRLVRKICEKCRVSEEIDTAKEAVWKGLPAETVKKHLAKRSKIRVYRGKGCTACHQTGYSGRIGIFEVMEVSEKIREMITAKAHADLIKNQAVKDGMTTMLEDGLIKVEEGKTTLDEVLRATSQ